MFPARMGIAPLALLFLGSIGSALPPPIEIDAQLGGRFPVALDGALAVDAARAAASLHVVPDPARMPGDVVLVSAPRARLVVLQRVEEGPVHGIPFVRDRTGTTSESYTVTNASIRLLSLEPAAQLAIVRSVTDAVPGRIEAQGPECRFGAAGGPASQGFPRHADVAPLTNAGTYGPRASDVVARCDAREVRATNPTRVLAYGMDLWVTSTERSERIRTGTFWEPDPNGLPASRRVTVVLTIHRSGDDLEFHLPFAASADASAPRFAALGTIRVDSTVGNLRWGSLHREGTVDAFEATGAFDVSSAAGEHLRVTGWTVDGPAAATPSAKLDLRSLERTGIVAGAVLAIAAWAAWGLFSKLSPHRVLSHPRRARLLEHVRNEPGIDAAALARAMDVRPSVVQYHLFRLSKAGHIVLHRLGGRTAAFVPATGLRGRESQVAALRRPTPRRVVEILRERPGLDQFGLAAALGLSQQRASQCLRFLEDARLVRRTRLGRRTAFFAEDEPLHP